MNRGRLTPLLWTALAGAVACNGSTEPSGVTWASRASLPVPRVDHSAVVLNGKIYVLGGFSGSTLARLEEYDPGTDTWTRKADMRTARRNFAAGVINGKIYVSSGMSYTDPNGVTYLTQTEVYDPAANTWDSLAPCPDIPAPNSVLGNVAITGGAGGGRLYVMVFSTNIQGFTATYEYNPGTNTWSTKSPPPFSYGAYAMGALGDHLFLSSSTSGAQVAEFSPVDNLWIIRAPLSRGWAGLGEVAGGLYAAGGSTFNPYDGSGNVVRTVMQYDAISDRWIARTGLMTARRSPAVVGLAGKLYVIGGSSSANAVVATPVATVEEGTVPLP